MHLVISCQVQKTHSGPVIGMVSKVSGLWHRHTNNQLNVELIAILHLLRTWFVVFLMVTGVGTGGTQDPECDW